MSVYSKGNNYQNEEMGYKVKEIFVSYTSHRGLISRIYKELQKTKQ